MSFTGMLLKELEDKIENLEETIKMNEANFNLKEARLKAYIANLELELANKECYIRGLGKTENRLRECFNCATGFKQLEKCNLCSNESFIYTK